MFSRKIPDNACANAKRRL